MVRICKACAVEKPIGEFPSGISNGNPYVLNTCTPCQREADRTRAQRYRNENREALQRRARLDKQIRYEKDVEFREKLKERSREYYRRNREKILAKKKERDRRAS